MKRRRSKNPAAAEIAAEIKRAEALSEDFHGRPIEWRKLDIPDSETVRLVHAHLGELRGLWVADESGGFLPIRFSKDRPSLSVTPDRRSLYVLGGNQEINFRALGFPREAIKDRMVFGELARVEYFTSKDFHNFEPKIYCHDFGSLEDGNEELLADWQREQVDEDGHGPRPVLTYDVLNSRFLIEGGAYTVLREGIVF